MRLSKKSSTGLATVLVFTFATMSALIGFGRESYIAYLFGASGETDAYNVASVVPLMLGSLLANALTNSLIPILKKERLNSENSARMLANSVFTSSVLLLITISSLAFAFRSPIMDILAPGLSYTEHRMAVDLLSIMVFSLVFSGLSGLLSGIHNSYESFSFPALVGIANNFLVLLVISLSAKALGINSLAIAFLIGSGGRFMIQFIPLLVSGAIRITTRLWHPATSQILRLMPPVLMSTGLSTVSLIVDRILASGLSPGSISNLNYASKLGLLPINLFAASLTATLYPRFVTNFLSNNQGELLRLVQIGLSIMFFVGCSVGITMAIYSPSILSILYLHGRFTAADVRAASGPLRVYGITSAAYLIPPLLTHFFYAQKENGRLMWASVISVLINVVLSVTLVRLYLIEGLVIANAFSQIVYVAYLLYLIVRMLRWPVRELLIHPLRISLLPTGLFISGVVLVRILVPRIPFDRTLLEIGKLGCSVGAGAIILITTSLYFRHNIICKLVAEGLTRKLHRLLSKLSLEK